MVLCVVSFAAGIVLDVTLDRSFGGYLAVLAIAIGLWCLMRADSKRVCPESFRRQSLLRESFASTCLLVALIGLGAFWHHGRWNWFGSSEIGLFADRVAKPCCVEADVLGEPRWMVPDIQDRGLDYEQETVRTKVEIRIAQIRDGDRWRPASGKLDLIIHAPTRHVRSGDRIRVFGRLVKSSAPTNPGQFDFQSFYRARGKLAFLHAYYPDSVHVVESAGLGRSRILSVLRQRLNDLTWRYIDADEAGFAAAILLGNREQLAPQRREQFLETGTVHLLAISGLHVGILAGSLFILFRIGLTSRRTCLWATILFVIFYAWLVEFRPPVSRAAILIVLYCVGRLLGESHFSFNLLAIAGLIVLIMNPLDLFGLGPQLSFLAVATLTFGKDWVFWPPPTDPIERLIANTRPGHVRTMHWIGRQFRTAVLVSGLIWIVAMPLVAYRFHLVAPVALIVNPLLLLPIAWALYGGLGVLVFGWCLPPVAQVCAWICQWNLAWIEWMIELAQKIPGSHLWTSGPSLTSLVVFYLGLFLAAIYPPTKLPLKWIALLAVSWWVFGWLVPDQCFECWQRNRGQKLACTFLDVGHGTGVLVELPNGQTLLYDAGSFGAPEFAARNVCGALWQRRIGHLDAVVISHADVDHFNALPEITRKFSIGVVYVSPPMLASTSPTVVATLEQLRTNGIPVREMAAGDQLRVDAQTKISVLSPWVGGTGGSDNSDSLVLQIEAAGRQILLPGDLESFGLADLLSREPIDFDLVMAPHHGSRNSQPTAFVNWSSPEYVVISGGSQRIQPTAVEAFRSDELTVLRTDQAGAIRYEVDRGGQASVMHWCRDRWRKVFSPTEVGM